MSVEFAAVMLTMRALKPRANVLERIASDPARTAVHCATGTMPLPLRAVSRLRPFRRAMTRSSARSQEVRS
jgi:hypothetical protein